jgi:cellulose synthase/poly-beta-1,6-N-acetylglucosamine synthase-like glycosyltransferase
MTPPLLSVVVIGRNEGPRLARCLQSIAAMEHPGFEFETIYVDSCSTDASVAIAGALGAQVIALRSPRPTAALGRNSGWRAARGAIVLFLDGDTILHPRFVADSLAEFDDPSISVVWGHRRETLETPSVYNRVLDLDWIYAPGFTEFCGGDALFRRATLEAAGGYDETLIAGEEPELCRRIAALGQCILHVDRPMTGHDLGIARWSAYWRRATRAGHAFAEVSSRFARTSHPFWLAESRRNTLRALVLLALPLFGAVLSLVLRSLWPLALAILCLLALAARTGWKARWKSNDWVALALYGVHSHLQQIPIFAGQLRFWINQRTGRRAALVEYKQTKV